ncbi:periplasmic substrate-binding component of an ABC superfamily oligopeptide transporter [Buttiauxella brennerae ATCC 51605]|uniref:Periplasmic substrate-binding component of an ABC superfamily oligopeptide transporter n=1 Tax=Buttiauxella brennerae ATCC 51605 TaxID=1354251 RepID=A0A1B7IV33_9ENTR|nr:SgrR family transcriptional regulator [Buttiauxella brennerae]OAT33830.1 periplasmic substrate-binding component of an ABC superfamily oligopeptide transporter [Buttiauxella brennerae ATCC 51605]
MRLLNRLNQFQRLWQPSAGEPQQVTVAELAARCFCSERHVRTLLNQLQDAGWLTWHAQSGRGKRGTLTFLVTPESVRSGMMEQVLHKGQHQNALELAQIAPEQLRQLLQPFLGGQWQNDTPTLRIPYYRPLETLQPGFLPGRAEQHLAGQVFAGLTRFTSHSALPQPDLAHHWQISEDGLNWYFFIRSTLHWHNGEPVETAQLQQRLMMLLALPAIRRLFISVKSIELAHTQCIRFVLHTPDYWLAHRLASYCSRLAHPEDTQLGCGPFRISSFKENLVRIESFESYHLSHPLLKAVEFWITPQLFDTELGTSCRHPVQIAIGQQDELVHLRPVSNSISLGFCYLAVKQNSHLTPEQARFLMQLIQQRQLIASLPVDESLITPSIEMIPGWEIPEWPSCDAVTLPPKLTLIYHLPVELHVMAQQLKTHLADLGCELTLAFHDAKNWTGCEVLSEADLIMGDRLIGEAPVYTLEQWLRSDVLWPAVLAENQYTQLQDTLDRVQIHPDETTRSKGLQDVFSELMRDAIVSPLFNYRYQISAPPGVNGIELNAWGWFDFTQAWLPPPTMV